MASVSFPWKTFSGKRATTSAISVLLVVFSLVLAACGGSSNAKSHTLWIAANVGGQYTQAYSPYNPNVNPGIRGMIYETLLFFDRAQVGSPQKWLASDYQFSADNKTLTMTIRDGVKWSDGQPFTANDVAFTFNAFKDYPAADPGLWNTDPTKSVLSSVTAGSDGKSVVFSFTKAQPQMLFTIGDQVYIMPEHIFKGKDIVKANDKPVGTGPMVLDTFTADVITYKKNSTFWKADSVKVDFLKYPTVKDNATLQLKLISGNIDWGGFFAPDLQTTFVNQDPQHNHFWMAQIAPNGIYLNLTKPPFNDIHFRKAVSLAIDRQLASQSGESGYEATINPSGLVLPANNALISDDFKALTFPAADKAAAAKELSDNGYTKGSDGFFQTPSGQKIDFKIDVPAGWSDWETIVGIVAKNLRDAGINAQQNSISQDDYFANRTVGKFDAFMGGSFVGPNGGYSLDKMLNSANIPNSNWEGYKNATVDAALAQFDATSLDDVAGIKNALVPVEQAMVNDLPIIPLLNSAEWFEYSTKNFTGFPDQNNPYALGPTYETPDNEQILLHLTPAN
jgi:peptide/nickel transport system substrate-binding protein